MSKQGKKPNQSSSYSPNSIGGRLDELLRQKLMNINTTTNENPKKSVQGEGDTQQSKKETNGIRPTEDSKD
jgi:hypothetical protein